MRTNLLYTRAFKNFLPCRINILEDILSYMQKDSFKLKVTEITIYGVKVTGI